MSVRPRKLQPAPILPHPVQPDWPAILRSIRASRIPFSQIASFSSTSRETLYNILDGRLPPSYPTGVRLLQLHSWVLEQRWPDA